MVRIGVWCNKGCFRSETMENGEGRVRQRMGISFWHEW